MIIGSGWPQQEGDAEGGARNRRRRTAPSNGAKASLDSNHGSKQSGAARSRWHASAPAGIREAVGADAWVRWQQHLAGKAGQGLPKGLSASQVHPLLWAAPARARSGLDIQGLERFVCRTDARRVGRRLDHWLARLPDAVPDAECALEVLAWAHAMPSLAGALPEPRWWELLDGFLAATRVAPQIDPAKNPLAHQLLAGELPLTLARLFPEVRACREAAGSGQRTVTLGLMELLNADGLPHAAHWDTIYPLLACWTRCLALLEDGRSGRAPLNGSALRQYRLLVRHALRLMRPEGARGPDGQVGHAREFDWLRTAAQLSGSPWEPQIAKVVLGPVSSPKKARGTASRSRWPAPVAAPSSIRSEPGEAAILRTDWSADSQQVTVAWHEPSIRIEIRSARQVFCAGPWTLDVEIDGRPARGASRWEEVCWVSDDDVDYLELQATLEGGHRVQRHLLLARADGFLWMGDSILGPNATPGDNGQAATAGDVAPHRMACRMQLPLCPGVKASQASETWDVELRGPKAVARVLPLALPEWRCDQPRGELRTARGRLELRQEAEGRNLFATLFVDLQPNRAGRPLTWRQLTVGESLRRVPDDVAVGYRVQIGRQQWLFYRSLAAKDNRTLLGTNTADEMLAARFAEGRAEALLQVEGFEEGA